MKRLLLGASGLIGSHIVAQAYNRELGVLVRKPIENLPSHIREYHCADSNDWPKRIRAIKPKQIICCIGTTMRKAGVGGQVQFRAVDQHLVLACAHYARLSGARHMIFVSSVGASERLDNIYLNAKGIVESELSKMGFERIDIIRPGLLLGKRPELRVGEAIGQAISPLINPLLVGSLRKFRSIPATSVAQSIWTLSEKSQSGRFIHYYDDLITLSS
jgi:uncharacterized protein YbjT (DUF2867 family)